MKNNDADKLAIIRKVFDGISAEDIQRVTGAPMSECKEVAKIINESNTDFPSKIL
jgi:hypothetical protein